MKPICGFASAMSNVTWSGWGWSGGRRITHGRVRRPIAGYKEDSLLTMDSVQWKIFEGITNWSAWLHEEEDGERLSIVRRNIQKNLPLPCGSETFVEQLEQLAGRVLRFRPVGRPGKG